MELLSWHNDPKLKAKAVAGYEAHMKADTLIKGEYFKHNGEFKGCHIGCVIHDLGGSEEGSLHEEYERVTGNPEWLAGLTEYFFEYMPHPQNQQVTRDILDATPVGKDLMPVYRKFMIWLLVDEDHGSIKYCEEAGVKATKDVAALHQRALDGDMPSESEWDAAGDAAWAAARAAQAKKLIQLLETD